LGGFIANIEFIAGDESEKAAPEIWPSRTEEELLIPDVKVGVSVGNASLLIGEASAAVLLVFGDIFSDKLLSGIGHVNASGPASMTSFAAAGYLAGSNFLFRYTFSK
jgi:hypothetical protein